MSKCEIDAGSTPVPKSATDTGSTLVSKAALDAGFKPLSKFAMDVGSTSPLFASASKAILLKTFPPHDQLCQFLVKLLH